ncbi:two-component response regulator [Sulfurimonas gotlandica GD1]|uniref:Two-component response regulator n=1 Tax=Sulfurimonas gotlandica (strain DSM 19862 / JCM 16533 / GD1) TaxID=929558 RepID=B6BIE0_SULGG|nr:response regulator [Sulfurimonas gotlandica]EDZ63635.1 DNA-binding response regulator [Sulfurimonas gotlandica GD1]EHP30293.1 two-component response regulator [Sulfurimonas gotlandica GD1]
MKDMLKNFTVLYVEDEDMVRKSAVEYLERVAKEVLQAKDGKEAIKVWREHKPDIIITDISMPRLNGIDMASYIRAHDKDVQIIIATAHSDTEYLLKAVELQLVKYIIKPITKEKLIGALEKSIELIEDKSKFNLPLSPTAQYNAYEKIIYDDGKEIKLTKNETLFLDLLAHHHTRVVKYEEIESSIWAYEGMSQDAIRSLVRGLRKKVPQDCIENISGSGYKLHIYSE